MKIGIIGCGIVGGACKFGFEKLGNEVIVHDPKFNTTIDIIADTDLVFISVPTPMSPSGSCDVSVVEDTIVKLQDLGYNKPIIIKSTVTPGFCESMLHKYKLNLSNCPEFLRERCAISDFVENHNLLVVGTHDVATFELVSRVHGHYPKSFIMLSPTQAELLKYMHNVFNALRVVFANEFYEIVDSLGENYTPIKNCLLKTCNLPDIYLDVNPKMRGYSSICWNKDVPALLNLADNLDLDLSLLKTIPKANDKFEKTPFEGTRE